MKQASNVRNGLNIDNDGTRYWYRDGFLHRENGPAVEWPDGSCEWWRNGELHREQGPAIERADGSKEWWFRGRQRSAEEVA